jgi:hypothetical protein
MLKIKFVNKLLILALVLFVTGTGFTAGTGPVPMPPILKLTVTQSPLAIYPPVMIYTAQLSNPPTMTAAALKVDFYHLVGTGLSYFGSAIVDRTGKAVLSKQMKAGNYTVIAQVVINKQVIWSNKVTYRVP